MSGKVIVIGPRDKAPAGVEVINTTSRVNSPFSPFLLGPCALWGNHFSRNKENAWQYSKVYKEHTDAHGEAGDKWLRMVEWRMPFWRMN